MPDNDHAFVKKENLRMRSILAAVWLFCLGMGFCANAKPEDGRPVTLVVIRHAETDSAKPELPLSAVGLKRAQILTETVRDIKFTHLIGTHTVRTKQMLEGTAERLHLAIVQLPTPGSSWHGETVTDQTSRRAPIEPVVTSIRDLPPGSVALVALNSENIYAIFNRLGIPEIKSCGAGEMCVPCIDNTCYPRKDFDHLWHVVLTPGGKPLVFTDTRYGQGWKPLAERP
jgi:hypothetical protein